MVLHSVRRIAVRVLPYSSGEKRNWIHQADAWPPPLSMDPHFDGSSRDGIY
jgi:hypothetical protein